MIRSSCIAGIAILFGFSIYYGIYGIPVAALKHEAGMWL
jgi:hypothetical protein